MIRRKNPLTLKIYSTLMGNEALIQRCSEVALIGLQYRIATREVNLSREVNACDTQLSIMKRIYATRKLIEERGFIR